MGSNMEEETRDLGLGKVSTRRPCQPNRLNGSAQKGLGKARLGQYQNAQ